MLKQIKIIFVDLDGTLLNDRNEATTYSKEIISKAVQKGIYVIICSGRANNDVIEKSRLISASPIIISSNGSMVFNYETDTSIYVSKIDLAELIDIWNFAQNNNINITFNSTYKRLKNGKSSKEGTVIHNIEKIENNITQIVADSNNYESIKRLKELIENKYSNLEVKNFWEQSIANSKEQIFEMDITNKFNSKGNAVNKVLNFLNISKENAACFGDQMNDFSMFQACGIKIAVRNANEKLKQKADFITEYTNNEDGVAKFIERYIL